MATNLNELEILYEALHSPIGIVVQTNNPSLAKAHLYKTRSESGDPALDCLQFRTSPFEPNSDIWIVKGTPKPDPTP